MKKKVMILLGTMVYIETKQDMAEVDVERFKDRVGFIAVDITGLSEQVIAEIALRYGRSVQYGLYDFSIDLKDFIINTDNEDWWYGLGR